MNASNIVNLKDYSVDNAVSSVKVFGGSKVVLYDAASYGDSYMQITANQANLASLTPNWDNKASSLKVRDSLWTLNQVGLYKDANYGGQALFYEAGESAGTMPSGWDNVISSVKIVGDVSAELYDGSNYSESPKTKLTVTADVPNLGATGIAYDNITSSVKAVAVKPFVGVCVYENKDYLGTSKCFAEGSNIPNLSDHGLDNKISSVKIFGGSQVVLYADANYMKPSSMSGHGSQLIKTSQNLDYTRGPDGMNVDLNDAVSSLKVRSKDWKFNQVVLKTWDGWKYLEVGETMAFTGAYGNWYDKVETLEIYGDAAAMFYEKADFSGATSTIFNTNTHGTESAPFSIIDSQPWGMDAAMKGAVRITPALPEQRACVYTEPDYSGTSVCFAEGTNSRILTPYVISGTPGAWAAVTFKLNIASVKVFGGAQLLLYDDTDYQGTDLDFIHITTDQNLNATWKDKAVSLKVRSKDWTMNQVGLYAAVNYGGFTRSFFERGDSIESFPNGAPLAKSSKIWGTLTVTLYESSYFNQYLTGGRSVVLTAAATPTVTLPWSSSGTFYSIKVK